MTRSSAIASRRFRTAARCAFSLLALAAAIFHPSSAPAVTFHWDKLGSGNFNDPNNWEGSIFFPFAVLPGPNDTAVFDVGLSSYTVTFPGNELVNDGGFLVAATSVPSYKSRNLRIRDSGVIFSGSTQLNRGSSTYTLTNVSETETDRGIIIGIDAGENAKLSLSHPVAFGGGLTFLNSAAATLGQNAGSTGTLNVGFGKFNITGSEANTTFTEHAQLIVGNNGTGNLNVTGGADVNVLGGNSRTTLGRNAGGVGNVKISGAGSTWTTASELWVGGRGMGALTVQNGGSLVTDGSGGTDAAVIAALEGSRGSVTITGAGSTWTNSTRLNVGNGGNGELIITNGGRLTHANGAEAVIGGNTFGIATVTGPGSQWVTPGDIFVQGRGTGALQILNGGNVTAGRVTMKGIENGGGEIFLSGGGSTLNVTNGALVVGKRDFTSYTGRTSLVINPGARVNVTHDVDLHINGIVKLQGGTLAAASIGSTAVLSQQIQGAFEWTSGTLHAGVVHSTNVINQGGKLAPGLSIGRTTIDGNYTQLAAASMEIQIAGLDKLHDFVRVEGSTILDGALQLALLNSFVPLPSQTFTILESLGGMTGAFSNVANGQRLATVVLGGTFQVNYGAGSAFNPNQIVLSDFRVDANLDFLERQRRFGQAPSRAAAIGGVPEPSAAILGCLAALGLAAVSRSRRAKSRSASADLRVAAKRGDGSGRNWR
jgi:T5SS/PEP-CTERM-associated repeat protein